MKTTDNKELISGETYFTTNGQEVILHVWGSISSGDMYLVSRVYESEATGNSVHKGDKEVVSEIFKHAPTAVISEEYLAASGKVVDLCVSLGFLSELQKDMGHVKRQHKKETYLLNKSVKNKENIERDISEKKEELASLYKLIEQANNDLNSISSNNKCDSEPEGSVVNTNQVLALRMESFKLKCLINNGVEGWDGYSGAMSDFKDEYPF